MPTEPIREQILQAVADRLKTISPARGYWYTPRAVLRKLVWLDGASELPLYIVLATTAEGEVIYDEMGDGGTITERLGVEITAMAQGSDAVALGTILNRMSQDVERALMPATDLRLNLGSIGVEDIRRIGFETFEVATDEWYRGLRAMLWQVTYNYALGSP